MANAVRRWFSGFSRFINNDPRMNRELERARENREFDKNARSQSTTEKQ